ncbi:MAG: feruloyl-CoA synthase [Proteobacteria bacterium]|nr:feruloyl-CoA synthase [Pseudomonadota bacterium]
MDTPRTIPDFAPALVEVKSLSGGRLIVRSPVALEPYAKHLLEYLKYWAEKAPGRTFLAERDAANHWQKISYRNTLQRVRSIAQALLDRGLKVERPVMILSENSIENGLLQLAAMYIGVPAVPVSPAYSLLSDDFGKLRYIFNLIQPGLIYAANGKSYSKALGALDLAGVEVVADKDFAALEETVPTPLVEKALAKVGPDTVAKILFTSGSTGKPKGVLNTHRMLCSNQQAMAQVWPFVAKRPPVLLDWLPWNHTFGGNHNFNMILRNGGTLYIDAGKPTPALFSRSVANLREVAPTAYFNVPSGYAMLLPYLEQDQDLRDHFFSRLDMIFYAAAALPQNLWERLEKLSLGSCGKKIPMTAAWGSTETAPLVTSVHFPVDKAGVIGLPVPGSELKLVPNGGKLEVRVRGPNVTPGYYKDPDLFAEVIDEDGFYKIGDAVKFADPDDPSKGLVFDGRIAEDFKLMTGSWVNVGKLRIKAISAGAPIIQDAVVTGHDRDEVGLLIFPNIEAAAKVAGLDSDTSPDQVIAEIKVQKILCRGLAAYNRKNPGSSTRIGRVLLLAEPPNVDANEITDKGYISQRAVLERRAGLVTCLYQGGPGVMVIQ